MNLNQLELIETAEAILISMNLNENVSFTTNICIAFFSLHSLFDEYFLKGSKWSYPNNILTILKPSKFFKIV